MALDTDGARVVIPHPPLRRKAVAGRPEFRCVPEKLVSNLTETKAAATPHTMPAGWGCATVGAATSNTGPA